jgi:hypothetical protein
MSLVQSFVKGANESIRKLNPTGVNQYTGGARGQEPYQGAEPFSTGVGPHREYDEQAHAATVSHLKSQGFEQSDLGRAKDITKEPTTYTMTTGHYGFKGDSSQKIASLEGGAEGHTTHTVVVHPDGSWEHTSEATHCGSDLTSLQHLNLTGWNQNE